MNKFKDLMVKFYKSWLWLIIPLLLLDQLTKVWALKAMWNITLIPNFLHLTYVRNTGAAWSILSGNMALLAFISAIVGGAIIGARYYYRTKLNPLKKALFAVIIAGTFGNFIDRAFYKLLTGTSGVVDFIHFQFGSYHFPIFNVADMCLTLGIIAFAIVIALEDIKAAKTPKPVEETKVEPKEKEKEEHHEEDNN